MRSHIVVLRKDTMWLLIVYKKQKFLNVKAQLLYLTHYIITSPFENILECQHLVGQQKLN